MAFSTSAIDALKALIKAFYRKTIPHNDPKVQFDFITRMFSMFLKELIEMARVEHEVITVPAPRGVTDRAMGKKLDRAIRERRKERQKRGLSGALKSESVHYISGSNPRYKIILSFFVFDKTM